MADKKASEKIAQELKALIRESRNASKRRRFDKAREAAQRGRDLAKKEGLTTESALLEAQTLLVDKRWDDAIALLTPIADAESLMPGMAWDRLGFAHDGRKEHDRAIECYRKALDTPGYDTMGDAWNNMGNAHSDKKEYDRAIECYQKALDTPGYDAPGDAWDSVKRRL